jgi:hypothetical protein
MVHAARLLASFLILSAAYAPNLATAAAQRTFVASSGNDANPCTLTQPCRGFARAITQTVSGGEIVVIDSAGYGPVTIGQSATIVAPSGVYAGVSVASGSGVTINGSGIVVTLRGLTITGVGGTNGIALLQGAVLNVEDCEIAGFGGSGIVVSAAGSVVGVRNTTVRDNAGSGVSVTATATIQANLDSVRLANNGLNGLYATGPVRATIDSSVVVGNGIGIHADAANVFITAIIASRNTIIRNTTGVQANANLALASVTLDANRLEWNGTAVSVDFQSVGYTFGNNVYAANTSDGSTLVSLSVK